MAAGDRLLATSDGSVMIDADGNRMIDDPDADSCCGVACGACDQCPDSCGPATLDVAISGADICTDCDEGVNVTWSVISGSVEGLWSLSQDGTFGNEACKFSGSTGAVLRITGYNGAGCTSGESSSIDYTVWIEVVFLTVAGTLRGYITFSGHPVGGGSPILISTTTATVLSDCLTPWSGTGGGSCGDGFGYAIGTYSFTITPNP